MNSNVRAKQLIVESPRENYRRKIDADILISAADRKKSESRTHVRVRGFDRNALKLELDRSLNELEENKKKLHG